MRRAIPLLLGLAICGAAEARSPWTQERGRGFLQLAVYGIGPYDGLFRSSGEDFRTGRRVTDDTIEVYAEYGLAERWTVLATVPWKRLETGDLVADATLVPTTIEAGSLSTLGNVELGVRRKLVDGAVALSGQLDLELPTGSFDERTGLASGLDAFTLTPTIGAGKGVRGAYLFGYVGLALRSGDFSHEWRAGAEAGLRLFGRVWLVGLVDSVRSLENGVVRLDRSNLETGLYVNDQEYLSFGFKLLVDLTKRVGLHATTYSASQGNLVARSHLSGLGAYYRW